MNKRIKKKKTKQRQFYNSLIQGLNEALEHAQGKRNDLRVTRITTDDNGNIIKYERVR